MLNSAGLLFVTQAILILQPTATQKQKINGTYTHSALNNIGNAALIAGLIVIEYNKIDHGGTHVRLIYIPSPTASCDVVLTCAQFESPHAIFGLITYILLAIQAFVGLTAFFTPSLYGSIGRAKSLYKYHRTSGYLVLTLMLTTVALATQTDYNKNALGIQLWAIVVLSMVVLLGILPRLRVSKLGLK